MSHISVSWRGGLPELVKELERQKKSRVDFVVDSRSIHIAGIQSLDMNCGTIAIEPAEDDKQVGEFLDAPAQASLRAIDQLGERVKPHIPSKFARELVAQYPKTAAMLFNRMLLETPSRILFRCLDGRCRAALSNKYRIFDDLDIAFTTMEVVKKNNGTIIECSADEARMEVKFTALHMIEHIPEDRGGAGNAKHVSRSTLNPNDFKNLGVGAVTPFVRVRHSGVGEGGLGVDFGLLRLGCINGAVMERVMNQIHLGAASDLGLLTEETIAADSKAIMLKARDLITASLSPATFKKMVNLAKHAVEDKIVAPGAAVANLVENADLTDGDKESILAYFLKDYDQNRWGLAQAVSRYSQDKDDANQASTLENIAGNLIKSNHMLAAVG